MCGISGFNWKDEQKIADMVAALAHRGPDAQGSFTEEGISLGHNRLSIIDLSAAANQPMFDEKEELVIVFNGEIYNFRELKEELKDYPYKTKSDTEVILAGYRKWGADVAGRLNGMFAFAIWDRRTKTLFCARDHAGMKPFYYYWDSTSSASGRSGSEEPSGSMRQAERFIFASEIRGLLTHDIPRTLNREALSHYLRVLYTPEPMTLVKNIFKLPASHTLTLRGRDLSIRPYEPASAPASARSFSQAASELRAKVLEGVKRHLIADVPVGVYLSGGIDSSIMLAAASRFSPAVKTFSIGFDLSDGEEE